MEYAYRAMGEALTDSNYVASLFGINTDAVIKHIEALMKHLQYPADFFEKPTVFKIDEHGNRKPSPPMYLITKEGFELLVDCRPDEYHANHIETLRAEFKRVELDIEANPGFVEFHDFFLPNNK